MAGRYGTQMTLRPFHLAIPVDDLPAARAWSQYEGSCSTLLPSPETVASFAQDRTALGLARIEAHYFAHDLFLPPLQMKLELLKKAVGVENVYDDGPDSEHQSHDEVGAPDTERESSFESELSQIKKAAGINPAVMQELSNDEPMDD